MNDHDLSDGGPAFPCAEDHKVASDIPWTSGMSKRELFAAILMHGEMVTCGVPGEAADRLVEASRKAGTDVIEHMAMNAVDGARALLHALGAPEPTQYRELYPSEQEKVNAAIRLATLVEETKSCPQFLLLPSEVRERLERASQDVLDPEIPF